MKYTRSEANYRREWYEVPEGKSHEELTGRR